MIVACSLLKIPTVLDKSIKNGVPFPELVVGVRAPVYADVVRVRFAGTAPRVEVFYDGVEDSVMFYQEVNSDSRGPITTGYVASASGKTKTFSARSKVTSGFMNSAVRAAVKNFQGPKGTKIHTGDLVDLLGVTREYLLSSYLGGGY